MVGDLGDYWPVDPGSPGPKKGAVAFGACTGGSSARHDKRAVSFDQLLIDLRPEHAGADGAYAQPAPRCSQALAGRDRSHATPQGGRFTW